MGLVIHFLILFLRSDAFDFFSYEDKVTLNPSTPVVAEKELFGWQIRFSPTDKAFYVSALNAIYSEESPRITKLTDGGMIYKCASADFANCVPWIVPSIREEGVFPKIRKLFGYSFILDDIDRSITVCAPNYPYMSKIDTFCMKFNAVSGDAETSKAFPNISPRDVITVHNYGTKIEYLDTLPDRKMRYLVSQHNCIHHTIGEDPANYGDYLVVATEDGKMTKISVSSIPSPEFILNPTDPINYLIVAYPYTSDLRGSFEVFTQSFAKHQYVNIIVGSAGQQFGYSATVGKFSDINCRDVVISAPFYSKVADEGVVFHFKCNSITHMFDEKPTLLEGDATKFGNFGFAVANLKDTNMDDFEDIIILQPNYPGGFPVLYIYTSGKGGFVSKPAKTILLDYPTSGVPTDYAYGLYSGFDWNEDQTNDVAVTYPLQNKVFVIPGLRFTQITSAVELKTLNPVQPEKIVNPDVPQSMGNSYYKISMKTCFDLKYLKEKDLVSNIQISFTHVITARPYSYFHVGGEFKPDEKGDILVARIPQELCSEFVVLFLNYPMPDSPHIVVKTTAKVKLTSPCTSSCIRPDDLVQETQIQPDFKQCEESSCRVQFQLKNLGELPTLVMGSINTLNIQIELENTGDVISSSPSISMKVPKSFNTKTFSFTTTSTHESMRHKTKILENDMVEDGFTAFKELERGEKITLNLEIQTMSEFGTRSIVVIFKAFDAMSKPVVSSPLEITLNVGEISILFYAVSTPGELSLLKESDTEVKMTEPLTYIIRVSNTMSAAIFKDSIIRIDLQLALEGKEIFTVAKFTNPTSISQIDCNDGLIGRCSPNTYYFSAQQIQPLEVLHFEVLLSKTANTGLLVDKNVTVINAKVTLFHETLEKEIQTIEISTKVALATKPSNIIIIIAICVSVGVGIILLCILAFIAYKMKWMEKIKTAASKQ